MLWTGFILGLFGSLHCLGMCGPIAITLPDKGSSINNLVGRALYNGGRILTYTLLGVFLGAFGSAIDFGGWQQSLSIIAGVIMLLSLISLGGSSLDVNFLKPFYTLSGRIKKVFSTYYRSKSTLSLLGIGIANGFLPCGLVYIALAGSLGMGDVTSSAAYMVIFGLGTFPMMFALSVTGGFMKPVFVKRLNKLVPFFIAAIGILFILRGLNLGIPYVSPDISVSPATQEWGEVCQ